jgi:DNA adenine methylase
VIGPLPYIGGKRRLAPLITTLIPEHTTYVEPFAGGCQVFFRKSPSRVEVLNDMNAEIVNFLRVCQVHPQELARSFGFFVASRRLHTLFSEQPTTLLTDIQRAARFLYLQKTSFGGQVVRRSFRFGVTKPATFRADRLTRLVEEVATRLHNVQVECGPYQEVLRRYDRHSTFFYLDPPYIGLELYQFNFSTTDFEELTAHLADLRGRFLLSINDCDLSRQLFGAFHVREVSVPYTATRKVKTVSELLVSNYELPASTPIRATA